MALARIALALCVCGALASEAAGEPREASPAGTPGRVTISPSATTKRVYQNDSESGRVSVLAGTLDFLIRVAYGINPRDVVYQISVDRQALYDVVAIPPDRSAETATRMMRRQLEAHFGFDASLEKRLVPVHVMRRVEGAIPLPHSTSKTRRVVGGHSRFSGTRASMGDLARFARTLTPKPVVDETGLDGVYDLVMEWDPSAGSHAMMQAFADLGLELIDGERRVEQLIVSPASRPKPSDSARPANRGATSDG